eukprot:6469919-Amphidinium_carterae.1
MVVLEVLKLTWSLVSGLVQQAVEVHIGMGQRQGAVEHDRRKVGLLRQGQIDGQHAGQHSEVACAERYWGGQADSSSELPDVAQQCLARVPNKGGFTTAAVFDFLLTCENGTTPGDWSNEELTASRFIACRMLWQLKEDNKAAFLDA